MGSQTWIDRAAKEDREARQLAPYGFPSANSAGRAFTEPKDRLRTEFERDRDRILHSTAFRRLMYKTQVFLNEEGDHNRTRLSHSLEVSQVARSLGSSLGLNEHLCEVLALSHDLGHPPFGHRGEVALDELLKDAGGFRHNAQVLRVVDQLERRSPAYPGLNLTREVRESLLKHETDQDWPRDFLPRPAHPILEAQAVDLADSTAYNKHDLEDGLRAGMFSWDELHDEVELWRSACAVVEDSHPGFLAGTDDTNLRVVRVTNQLMGLCIDDLLQTSSKALALAAPTDPVAAQECPRMLIRHSELFGPQVAELARFLHRRFYRHEHLQRFLVYAHNVLEGLVQAYRAKPEELAPWYLQWSEQVGLERAVCDYVAGMTDRFAQDEFARLVGELPRGFLR
ncbi:MAG: dGTPase [Planctomycetota bacterium]|jgi:dGTPase